MTTRSISLTMITVNSSGDLAKFSRTIDLDVDIGADAVDYKSVAFVSFNNLS